MTIKTFVFFDLETTGIPANQAKVTEITLISVLRSDIQQADKKKLPPMNKLTLLCNPQKNIQPAAAKITGLTNDILKNQPTFKNIIKCINSFLDKPKPVCLIAHNGNRYDFKILQAEYINANENLPVDLVCVDSLNVFRNILKEPKDCSKNNRPNNLSLIDSSTEEKEWLDLSIEEVDEIDELVSKFSGLASTPKSKNVKKDRSSLSKDEKPAKMCFKLCSLYERLLNKKVLESHRAEADCIMLLECVVATKNDFLPYADSIQKPLKEIKL